MSADAAPTSRYKFVLYLHIPRICLVYAGNRLFLVYPGYIVYTCDSPSLYQVYPCQIHSKVYIVYTCCVPGI
jgi:hypothetical protein